MDPDQDTASDLRLHHLLKRLPNHFCRRQKQVTFAVISALRVNTHQNNKQMVCLFCLI